MFIKEISLFQSLIGWLQTILNNDLEVTTGRFQSLIGWLQTASLLTFSIFSYWFQSLIGWLQTSRTLLQTYESCLVSIPYRLATNKGNILTDGWVDPSFNPLQVGYKLPGNIRQAFHSCPVSIPYRLATNVRRTVFPPAMNPTVSIPYRLATNSISKYIAFQIRSGFNPLQVGYKPPIVGEDCTWPSVFQSLIGWLQTKKSFLHLCLEISFQSLIGWLQTRRMAFDDTKQGWQFQSLIGWLQTASLLTFSIFSYWFQSLIGWLQTCVRYERP